MGIEYLVIINVLTNPAFAESNIWWTEDYYLGRKKIIMSTYPSVFTSESITKFHYTKNQD